MNEAVSTTLNTRRYSVPAGSVWAAMSALNAADDQQVHEPQRERPGHRHRAIGQDAEHRHRSLLHALGEFRRFAVLGQRTRAACTPRAPDSAAAARSPPPPRGPCPGNRSGATGRHVDYRARDEHKHGRQHDWQPQRCDADHGSLPRSLFGVIERAHRRRARTLRPNMARPQWRRRAGTLPLPAGPTPQSAPPGLAGATAQDQVQVFHPQWSPRSPSFGGFATRRTGAQAVVRQGVSAGVSRELPDPLAL